MRCDDEFLKRMAHAMQTAMEAMDALEHGAIANPDENRMVGHYWLRDPDLAPDADLKHDIVDTLQKIHTFAQKVHSGEIHPPDAPRFTDVLSVGIGGSALGPQFVAEALGAVDAPMTIHFIDNTDPAGIDRTLTQLKERLATTLVVITSKSGGTPETRNGMLEVKHAY
jgi:glucose-6-phosphate isomerase